MASGLHWGYCFPALQVLEPPLLAELDAVTHPLLGSPALIHVLHPAPLVLQRLVLLSGRGEAGAQRAERYLQNSGADWTIVRCAFFNQNFDENFVDSVRHGVVGMPAGDTAEPFVDADDIADVVVAALTDDRHIGELYELTGPRLLTIAEAAKELSVAIGREVRYVPLTAEQFGAELGAHGIPEADATHLAELLSEVLDGRSSHLGDGVQRALGRPARDFADYARDTAATGAWNPEAVAA
ncbi:hypothetical protein ICNINCKA_00729 [Synechococcus sp. CBW1107]|nr:hypothetical protein ICNINCKA_00729 [Synechococcus sp. CBW1107]